MPLAARAADGFVGIVLHAPASDVAERLGGPPTAVESTDRGHIFTWVNARGTLKLIVDDDARVQAIDLTPIGVPVPAAVLDIDGKATKLAFGSLTDTQTDSAFAAVLDSGTDTTRALRLTPTLECVLFYGKTHVLERAVYGSRGALVAQGLIADDPLTRALPYVAPALKHSMLTTYTGDDKRRLVARLHVDTRGIVRAVDVAIPSGDAAGDARAVTELGQDSYVRAMLGARPMGATIYREVVPH